MIQPNCPQCGNPLVIREYYESYRVVEAVLRDDGSVMPTDNVLRVSHCDMSGDDPHDYECDSCSANLKHLIYRKPL